MSILSTTSVGRAFEYHSLRFLNHQFHMSLLRVGKAGDQGVDLQGHWWIPSDVRRVRGITSESAPLNSSRFGPSVKGSELSLMKDREEREWERKMYEWGKVGEGEGGRLKLEGEDRRSVGDPGSSFSSRRRVWPRSDEGGKDVTGADDRTGMKVRRLRVYVQCKAESKPVAGKVVREMEGVMAHFVGRQMRSGPHQYTSQGIPLDIQPSSSLGIIVSQSGFSHLAMTRAFRSPSPFLFIHLPGGTADQYTAEGELVYPDGERGGSFSAGQVPSAPTGTRKRPATDLSVPGGDVAASDILCQSAWWNDKLSGEKGVLGDRLELRQFFDGGPGRGTYKVCWKGGEELGRLEPESLRTNRY